MAAVAQDALNQPQDELHALADRQHWENTPLARPLSRPRGAVRLRRGPRARRIGAVRRAGLTTRHRYGQRPRPESRDAHGRRVRGRLQTLMALMALSVDPATLVRTEGYPRLQEIP
ncbi:hypothetical protein GCM10010271_00630 [Streptomyces kurssanovii]|nr:hypothetical protein GCM10010271_00630 [Streptomyces kurssanovii]